MDHRDVPGLNVTSGEAGDPEPIFSEGVVGYAGQSLGLVRRKGKERDPIASPIMK